MIRRTLPLLAALLLVGCPPTDAPVPGKPRVPTTWTTEPHPQGTAPRIDIVFCLDSTGSMQNVIDTAKDKIREIAHWIENGQPKPTVRFAVVCYRDKGETYVTKTYPFTPDVSKIEAALGEIIADGGGDVHEHVVAGLKVAVQDVKWDTTAKLKLVFLLGDAPPHLDYDAESNVDPILETAKQQNIAIGAFV